MIQPTRRAVVLVAAAVPLSLAIAALDAGLWPIGLAYLLIVLAMILLDALRALPPRRLSVAVRPIDSLFIGEMAALNISLATDWPVLPEAVEALRAIKKNPGSAAGVEIKLSACDPLNLSGVILPGPRVPAVPSTFILFRDGLPVRVVSAKGPRPEDGEILTLSRGASLGP